MDSFDDFDPFTPEVIADPYPSYQRLAKSGPVNWLPMRDMWIVTGYDSVTEVLREPTVFSSAKGYAALAAGALNRDGTSARSVFDVDVASLSMLISTDPPNHTRIRRLLSRTFTPRAVGALEPRLREVCAGLVNEAVERASGAEADLVQDLSITFPVTVIAEMLDIPLSRRDEFRSWSDAMSGVLSGDATLEEAEVAGAEIFMFMSEMIALRRAKPGDDLLSKMVIGNPEGDPDSLTTDDMVLIGILLLIAGNETTTNLISNMAAALAAHPDQAARVWADPGLLPAVIEETLRWDSPVQGMLRGAMVDTRIGDVEIPAKSIVMTCLAAANRDPAHYPAAEQFDIDRKVNDHLAFGNGIHFCLGASVARLEARMVFETLIEAGVGLTPLEGATRTSNFMLRGFSRLPVIYSRLASA
jgi:cytochrome P450